MSKKFDALVDEALAVERELRVLTPDRPSLRCFISECLTRGDAEYPEVEGLKEKLADPAFERRSGCGAYIREVTRVIAQGKLPEPPATLRIGGLHWAQKDQAVLELGGQASSLFLLMIIAAERAHEQNPKTFGTVEDLAAHKARIAGLEAHRKDLHERIAGSWDTSDIVLGPIASDFAALVSWKMAPDVPVGKDAIAERLIEHLLAQEGEAQAKVA